MGVRRECAFTASFQIRNVSLSTFSVSAMAGWSSHSADLGPAKPLDPWSAFRAVRAIKIIDVPSIEIIDVNFRCKAGSKYRCLFSLFCRSAGPVVIAVKPFRSLSLYGERGTAVRERFARPILRACQSTCQVPGVPVASSLPVPGSLRS